MCKSRRNQYICRQGYYSVLVKSMQAAAFLSEKLEAETWLESGRGSVMKPGRLCSPRPPPLPSLLLAARCLPPYLFPLLLSSTSLAPPLFPRHFVKICLGLSMRRSKGHAIPWHHQIPFPGYNLPLIPSVNGRTENKCNVNDVCTEFNESIEWRERKRKLYINPHQNEDNLSTLRNTWQEE